MILRDMRAHRFTLAATFLAASLACDDHVAQPPPTGGGTVPDTSPPLAINDLALAYDSLTHRVSFTWTARRDDDTHDRAERYDIRHAGSFPFDWEQSTRVADPPVPLPAGSVQEYWLPAPPRGSDVYASIRARDAAGNESAAGSVAHARVPGLTYAAVCSDVYSGTPVAGLDVTATWRRVDRLVTGSDGAIVLRDLPAGSLQIHILGGGAASPCHTFDDVLALDDDITVMYTMIPFEQPDTPLYPSMLAMLRIANFYLGTDRVIKRWHDYPVPWYAPDFVNINGINYRDFAAQATERWNARMGFQMFAPVAVDPAVGVKFEFLPRSTMGTVTGVTRRTSDAEGYPLHDVIQIVDDFSDETSLYPIMIHELGHTIRLNHLPVGFIMSASTLPPDITDDEVRMVKLMLALPNGTNLDRYDEAPPAP